LVAVVAVEALLGQQQLMAATVALVVEQQPLVVAVVARRTVLLLVFRQAPRLAALVLQVLVLPTVAALDHQVQHRQEMARPGLAGTVAAAAADRPRPRPAWSARVMRAARWVTLLIGFRLLIARTRALGLVAVAAAGSQAT
jgi:hypothetical protein